MLTRRIAALVTTIVLGVSGVALAHGGSSVEADASTQTAVSLGTTATTSDDSTSTSMTSSTAGSSTSVTAAGSSTTSATVAGSSTTSVTTGSSTTSSTIDDDSTTSTTIDDRDDRIRTTVQLGLATYTVGEAGTVTVNGMTLVAVQANTGWTVQIDEVSADKIKIEFEKGETDAEFELRADGELRIRTHD